MKTLIRTIVAISGVVGLITLANAQGAPPILKIGTAAPKLTVSKWVKGAPVTQFKHGSAYVVEFWATWCGPCKESIPELTSLAKKFKKVTFIGVSVQETNWANVAPFVKKMGSKMDYHVATDTTPTAKFPEGTMADSWLLAYGQQGIPTAFVVNKSGKIAWIGSPSRLGEYLKAQSY